MDTLSTFHRSILPHVSPIGANFFITWRCKDALPIKIVRQLKAKYESEVRRICEREFNPAKRQILIHHARYRFFKNYEHQLDDQPFGACHLRKPEIAKIVMDKLHQFDEELYDLITYTIMPNHCHLVIDMSRQLVDADDIYLDEKSLSLSYQPLHEVMRRIKGGSSREINKQLGLTGTPFWQKDSYDHYIRDQRAFRNVVGYTLGNAVAEGFVEEWQDWPFTWHRGMLPSG